MAHKVMGFLFGYVTRNLKVLKNPTDLEIYYLLCGVGASVMASIVKTIKATKTFTKIGILKMVADAISCAILTLGISMSIHEYYGASLVYAVGIGAFVGSLGNTVIIELASSVIRTFLNVDTKKENEAK